MTRLRAALLWLVMPAALALPAAQAAAQGNFEIQVYGSETVAPGTTMVELHSNSAIRGTTRTEDGIRPTQHAVHETLEVTQGWTSWFETGFYVFTSIQPDTRWEWVGNHIRPRVRAPESWELPVGLSLSAEVGYQRRAFSTDTWTIEMRPIIDKQWRAGTSRSIRRSTGPQGPGTSTGVEFSPDAKVAVDVTKVVASGSSTTVALGRVDHFEAPRHQHHLFRVVDLDVGPRWEFKPGSASVSPR